MQGDRPSLLGLNQTHKTRPNKPKHLQSYARKENSQCIIIKILLWVGTSTAYMILEI